MPTPKLTTYSADEVSVTLGSILVDGFADGTFVTLEQETETFGKVVGSDGKVSRFKTLNRSGSVTISVMQTSLSNDLLNALHILDRDAPNGAGIVPMTIRDRSGRSVYFAAQAWIAAPPKPTFGREVESRDWTIHFAEIERTDAGN